MTIKEKRSQIETMVLKTMSLIDKTGLNTKKYKEFFKSMSDEKFKRWMNEFLKDPDKNFYMELLPHKNEPVLKDLMDAGKYLDIPLEEYIYLYDTETKKRIRTKQPVPVGYLSLKKLQQMLMKKNSYSLDISVRNQKTGLLTADSRVARITEAEQFALAAYGAKAVQKELMGPRADDSIAKSELYKSIMTQGYAKLSDLTDDKANKQTLNTVDVFFLGCGIKTDLITDGLELRRTIENKKRRQTAAEKAQDKFIDD